MPHDKSEFALIDWIRRHGPAKPEHVVEGIGDDMAVLQVGSETLLITTDILLEHVHFDLSACTLEQVGYKAMACSLSDCAAMAALPLAAVVAVALPEPMTMAQAKKLHEGIQHAALKYSCPIVGGDTTSWPQPLAIDVTMLAHTPHGAPILRRGAQPGDALIVTGQLGGALAGKHFTFTPRLAEAQLLTQLVPLHAMIDISDGLAPDLRHLCRAGNVAAVIDAASLPLSNAARNIADPVRAALTDGEDFELLFCLSPDDAKKLQQTWTQHSDTPLTRIGQITDLPAEPAQDTPYTFLRRPDGSLEPLTLSGWEHFRG